MNVSDASTGDPREDIIVGIYNTEKDAQNMENLVISTKNTDASGTAKFSGLDEYNDYWVRAQGVSAHSIKEASNLDVGGNYLEMEIN